MVQLGWNAGPRHARVWGLAKSFTRALPNDVKLRRDRDAVAMLSMVWGIIRTHMPRDSVDKMETVLENVGMPSMATRTVDAGECTYPIEDKYWCSC